MPKARVEVQITAKDIAHVQEGIDLQLDPSMGGMARAKGPYEG